MDASRMLLDQLMGKDRNMSAEERSKRRLRWDDEAVCKFFLCGFCPHDLFTNTKSDLGQCGKEHDDQLRQEFEKQSAHVRQRFESQFFRYLQELLDECDKKIVKGQSRLASQAEDSSNPELKEITLKVDQINENIKTLNQQIEKLGTEGKVEESQGVMKLVEGMKKEKQELEQKAKQIALPVLLQKAENQATEKRMKVCEVCAALLVINDADSRVQAHLTGKQHVGFEKIRQTLKDYHEKKGKYYY